MVQCGFFPWSKQKDVCRLPATEQIQTRLGLPSDLLRLPFTGNATFDGSTSATIDLAPLDVSVLHYRSFSAGIQRTLGERFSVGARLSRLLGYHHLAIEENQWGLTTDANDWTWNLEGGGRIVSSGMKATVSSASRRSTRFLDSGVAPATDILEQQGVGR